MDVLGVEIDRKLFITCRLCLEEDGVYQIVPSVQLQINYCFGIVVEHFDGLPQLVCKKCKLLLNEYAIHKRTFIEKQEALKRKFEEKVKEDNKVNQENPATDTLPKDSESENEEGGKKLSKAKKRKKRFISTSSSDSFVPKLATKKIKYNSNKYDTNVPTDWQKKYFRHFVCRFCSTTFKNKGSIYKHCKTRHSWVRSKYSKILDVKCSVTLHKTDNKPNMTGLSNTVVLSKNKIVQDAGHQLCYIVYSGCDKQQTNSEMESVVNNSDNNSEHSSGQLFVPHKLRKRFRLDTESSNDTVVIGNNSKTKSLNEHNKNDGNKSDKEDNNAVSKEDKYAASEPKDTICIDDSSDSDTALYTHSGKANSSVNRCNEVEMKTEQRETDMRIIKEIITVCRKKYESRRKLQANDNATAQVDSQLKHKILSIGRKTLNKRTGSYNCNGLLRYLEQKNLNVVWEVKAESQAASKVNFVRMFIKSKPNPTNDDVGWVDVEDTESNTPNVELVNSDQSTVTVTDKQALQESILQNILVVQPPQMVFSQPQDSQQPQMVVPQITIAQEQHNEHYAQNVLQNQVFTTSPQMIQFPHLVPQPLILQQPQIMGQAVLYPNMIDDPNTKKLLNTAPVANPKQLPKKTSSSHLTNRPTVINEPVIVTAGDKIDETNMLMPVITSTTSLAEVKKDVVKSKPEEVNSCNNIERPLPRIKVKSASELMKPVNTTNTVVSQPSSIWNYNQIQGDPVMNDNSLNIFVPNNLVSQIQSQSAPLPSGITPISNSMPQDESRIESEQKKNYCDYLILDTVDFPNTKTDSPFKYFRNLLLLHDIILTEANATLSRDFVCLLKFKVQFKQENKNLTLCLSLFCSDNKFCMSVKDGNFVNIHMGKMSANWQWEIMKVYRGDVTNKILINAQKAGHNVYTKTKTFLYLLKSINQR